MRDYLIRLAIKYSGDYFKIEKAIKNTHPLSEIMKKELEVMKKEYEERNYKKASKKER